MSATEPVGTYMSAPVQSIDVGATLEDVSRSLQELAVSSLPVVDGDRIAGVISYTDLLRVGIRAAGDHASDENVHVAKQPVTEAMTPDVFTIDVGTQLRDAAKEMVDRHIHRLYVEANGVLAGVLSTRDLMLVVRDSAIAAPIGEFMTTPVVSVSASQSIADAVRSLDDHDISALVVLDEHGWPIGMFSQREALESGHQPKATPVEHAMSRAILALPPTIAMHRAAAQAALTRVRRVAAVEVDAIAGILSGLDFARALL